MINFETFHAHGAFGAYVEMYYVKINDIRNRSYKQFSAREQDWAKRTITILGVCFSCGILCGS